MSLGLRPIAARAVPLLVCASTMEPLATALGSRLEKVFTCLAKALSFSPAALISSTVALFQSLPSIQSCDPIVSEPESERRTLPDTPGLAPAA